MSWIIEGDVAVHHSEKEYMRGTLKAGDSVDMAGAVKSLHAEIVELAAQRDSLRRQLRFAEDRIRELLPSPAEAFGPFSAEALGGKTLTGAALADALIEADDEPGSTFPITEACE